MSGGLDLTGVARTLDGWIVDHVKFTRDGGVSDDDLDEETGLLSDESDPEVVYEGRGMFQLITAEITQTDPDVIRVVEETGAKYRAMLPIAPENAGGDVSAIRVGDKARVVEQHSEPANPDLTSLRTEVVHVGGPSSFTVARFVYLKQV